MSDVLRFAKAPALRKETVEAPELGGAVIVRGLLLRESIAVSALRSQALRRVREEAAERAAAAAGAAAASDGPTDAAPAAADAADGVTLRFDELLAFGSYVAHLLHCAVTTADGGPLYSADQWEVVGQSHPALIKRLEVVAERLSGFDAEEVEKNSAAGPS